MSRDQAAWHLFAAIRELTREVADVKRSLAELKEHLETYGQAAGGVHIHLGSDDSETSSSSGETELSVQSAPASFQL
jgi:hypothetical protein